MKDRFETRWPRGDLGDEGQPARTPRRREGWQQKHDVVFHAVWGQQPRRRFPAPRPELAPIARTRRKPGKRLGLVLLIVFAAGVVGGWLLK